MKRKYLSKNSKRINKEDLFYEQTNSRLLYGGDEHLPLLDKVVPYLPLSDNYCKEGFCDMPIVPAFNMDIDCEVIPWDKIGRNHNSNTGVHGFVSDKTINRFINNPFKYLDLLREHRFVVAPECSTYSALPKMVNLQSVFLCRNVNCFLQEHGVPTIPCYTYSTFDSVEYSLWGLPHHSTIAVGNHVVGRHEVQHEIVKYAIQELIKEKHPIRLLVYGEPLGFDVDVEIVQVGSRIQELRKLKK